MLFKSLGFITSMGNLAVIMGLIYNDTILDFNTAHWNVGVGSLLFLLGLSVLFFLLNNQKTELTHSNFMEVFTQL